MKHTAFTKGAVSLLVAAVMLCQPMTVLASEGSARSDVKVEGTIAPEFSSGVSTSSITYTPVKSYSLLQSVGDFFDSLAIKKQAGNVCTSLEETAATLRAGMVNRASSVTVNVDFNTATTGLQELGMLIYDKAVSHTGNPVEGDYLKFQFGGGSFSGDFRVTGNNVNGTFRFSFTYYTSASEEQAMDAETNRITQSLALNGKSDVEKAQAIYRYIADTTSYDYAHLNNTGYLKQFTGYAALIDHVAVCQGYSVAFYRLALMNGLDARVIAGTGYSSSASGPHGWNIVGINGTYYNLDVTWDAGHSDFRYFLKSPASFDASHVRDAEYTTASFHASYPMASSDYDYAAEEARRRAEEEAKRLAEEEAAKAAAEAQAQAAQVTPAITTIGGYFDVAPQAYYASAVDWARAYDVTLGIDNSYFLPNEICTRALTASLIWCAEGRPSYGLGTHFVDVADYSYYAEAINWAYITGVTAGTSATEFSPDLGCTRAQVVTFLWKASGSPEPATLEQTKFVDVAPDAYYRKAVCWALENGITAGTSETTFSPNIACTRAHIITFLYKAFR